VFSSSWDFRAVEGREALLRAVCGGDLITLPPSLMCSAMPRDGNSRADKGRLTEFSASSRPETCNHPGIQILHGRGSSRNSVQYTKRPPRISPEIARSIHGQQRGVCGLHDFGLFSTIHKQVGDTL
jgi:hypothetical protein